MEVTNFEKKSPVFWPTLYISSADAISKSSILISIHVGSITFDADI